MTRTLVCLWALAVVGCADSMTMISRPWPTLPDEVDDLAARYPHAPAVVLRREDHYAYVSENNAIWFTERYEAVAVLTEGGERYAEIAVPVGSGELRYLRARTRLPGGTVVDVQPAEVHETFIESAQLGAQKRKVKVFRLPNVRPGSIIEYSYGYTDRSLHFVLADVVSRPIPIRHYHLEFTDSGPFRLSFRLYNRTAEVHKESKAGLDHASLDLHDIPAYHAEPFAPPPTVTEPWWMLVMTHVVVDHYLMPIFASWPDALRGLSSFLYEDSHHRYGHVSFASSLGACQPGTRCAIERAVELVRDRTDLAKMEDDPTEVRPLAEVLAAHSGNNFEKAMLLYRALEQFGVEARFALVARNLEQDLDPNFPSPRFGDHLVLYVNRAVGLDGPLFLDPSCESCRVGDIPTWIAGRQALSFYISTGQVHAVRVEWLRTPNESATPSIERHQIEAQLDGSGTLSGRFEGELTGDAAIAYHLGSSGWRNDKWQKEVDALLHARSAAAQVRSVTPPRWDKGQARLRFGLEYDTPGYATPDGDRLAVPLSFLRGSCDEEPSDEPRTHDVMIRSDRREEETLTLHTPSGYVVASLPTGGRAHVDAADGLVEISAPSPTTIRVRRLLQIHAGHWGPAEYDDLVGLMRKLAATRQQVVILEKARPGGGRIQKDGQFAVDPPATPSVH